MARASREVAVEVRVLVQEPEDLSPWLDGAPGGVPQGLRLRVAGDFAPKAGRVANEDRLGALGEGPLDVVNVATVPPLPRGLRLSAWEGDVEVENHGELEIGAEAVHGNEVRIIVGDPNLQLAVDANAMNGHRGLELFSSVGAARVNGVAWEKAVRVHFREAQDVGERNADAQGIQGGVVGGADLIFGGIPAQEPGPLDPVLVHVFDHLPGIVANPVGVVVDIDDGELALFGGSGGAGLGSRLDCPPAPEGYRCAQ